MVNKQPQPAKRRHWRKLVMIGLPILFTISGIWLNGEVKQWRDEINTAIDLVYSCHPDNPENIEADGQFSLPSTAQVLTSTYCGGFTDYTFSVQFEMNASDFDKFIDSTMLKTPLVRVVNPEANKTGVYLRGEVTNPNCRTQRVLVDVNDDRKYIVYLTFLKGIC